MEEVSLSEPESHYYADLFQRCDEEQTGKITMLKATELYRAADISNEKIQEIMGLAGIPSTALHISRAQFYSCLKLIAAHQSSIPLWKQLIAASVTLPLPSFRWTDAFNNPDTKTNLRQTAAAKLVTSLTQNENILTTTNTSADALMSSTHNSDVQSTDSEVERCESSCGGDREDLNEMEASGNSKIMHHHHHHHHHRVHHNRGSPEAWSTNSDSPTPTNSVAERSWFKDTMWPGLLGEEHKQLLGTEEESSDRHSSDEENDIDLDIFYQITQEQRDYYLKQFKQVTKNNVDSLLSGQEAKVFFEKSRIPVEELRHIWELCDVTRDGALSLAEFTAAMHLVVLRRNNIPLPTVLPTCLHPTVLFPSATATTMPPPVALGNTNKPELDADLILMVDDEEKIKSQQQQQQSLSEQTTMDTSRSNAINLQQQQQQQQQQSLNSNLIMSLSTLSIASQGGAVNSNNTSINTQQSSLTSPTITRSVSNSPKLESLASPPSPPPPPPTLSQVSLTTGSTTSNNTNNSTLRNRGVDWPVTETQGNQWTKFAESPTTHVSSPGPKPVNFDIQLTTQAVVSDPQILHPVALRVTPVGGTGTNNLISKTSDYEQHGKEKSFGSQDNTSPTTQSSSVTVSTVNQNKCNNPNNNGAAAVVSTVKHPWESSPTVSNYGSGDLRAIQRPQAKKIPNKSIGALPPPPQRSVDVPQYTQMSLDGDTTGTMVMASSSSAKKDGPPPLPPPRPRRHTRSSSLDLNKYKTTNVQQNGARRQLNDESYEETTTGLQAASTTMPFFADFAHFPQNEGQDSFPENTLTNNSSFSVQQAPYSLPVADNKLSPSSVMPNLRFTLQSNQRTSAFEVYRKPNSIHDADILAAEAGSSMIPKLPTAPFGALTAAARMSVPSTANANLIETLKRSQTSKVLMENTYNNNCVATNNNNSGYGSAIDLLRQLREQNKILLSLCGDLNDELLIVQARREDMRLRLETHKTLLKVQYPAGNSTNDTTGRIGSSISAPVTANVTGGSVNSGIQSNA